MDIAQYIDHTNLSPSATKQDITKLCQEAIQYHFKAVCVTSYWTEFCAEQLSETNIKLASVLGFPHGNSSTEIKVYEAKHLVNKGADELDMVLNVGLLKAGAHQQCFDDIRQVVETAKSISPDILVKVIIETALLTDEEKVTACELIEKAKADFVKTSTGFAAHGATIEDIKLMKTCVGDRLKIKASGGIKTLQTARAMLDAGANRLGCLASIAIAEEQRHEKNH